MCDVVFVCICIQQGSIFTPRRSEDGAISAAAINLMKTFIINRGTNLLYRSCLIIDGNVA